MHPAAATIGEGARLRQGAREGFLVLTCGSAALLLALYPLASLAAARLGPPWGALAVAVDPAVPGSLADRCGHLLLAIAASALLLAGNRPAGAGLRLLALLPGALLLVDAADLASRAAALTRPIVPVPAAKLAVAGLLAVMALLPACLALRGPGEAGRALAGRLLCLLLLVGPPLLALDMAGGLWRWLGGGIGVKHALAVVEEGGELLLYAALAGMMLGDAMTALARSSPGMRLYGVP